MRIRYFFWCGDAGVQNLGSRKDSISAYSYCMSLFLENRIAWILAIRFFLFLGSGRGAGHLSPNEVIPALSGPVTGNGHDADAWQ